MLWLETYHFEVVVLEGEKVFTPSCFDVLDEAIALEAEGLVDNDVVAVTEYVIHSTP